MFLICSYIPSPAGVKPGGAWDRFQIELIDEQERVHRVHADLSGPQVADISENVDGLEIIWLLTINSPRLGSSGDGSHRRRGP
jgi:hypothetical protein